MASESLSALRTVHAFNANEQEEKKFNDRIKTILSLARKEAIASGIFYGSTGWSGNITVLGLLGYGMPFIPVLSFFKLLIVSIGGSLVSQGVITVGDLTSLLLYTVYVGNGLSMLTYV